MNALARVFALPAAPQRRGFRNHSMRVVTSSKRHKWRSDPRLLWLVEEFAGGRIGLDPCASKFEKHHFAETNYTLHNGKDGLALPWLGHGVAYANPEYQRKLLIAFIRKAVDEFVIVPRDGKGRPIPGTRTPPRLRCGEDDHLFLLVPARPDTRWFQLELLPFATAMCFWRGRMRFSKSDPAPFPSLVLYFGRRPARFRELFSPHGWVPATEREP